MAHLDFDIIFTLTQGLRTLTGATEQGLAHLRALAPDLLDGTSVAFPDDASIEAALETLDGLGLITWTPG